MYYGYYGYPYADSTNTMGPNCPFCLESHTGMCPKIKAVEYHPDNIIRIEFWGEHPQAAE